MSDESTPKSDLEARIAKLEAELARVKYERDMYKETIYSQYRESDPYEELTPEELHDMVHGPRGESIISIVEEFERKLAGS